MLKFSTTVKMKHIY